MTILMDKIYIGGNWQQTKEKFTNLNPTDGSIWAEVADADIEATENAIKKANSAFKDWSKISFNARAHYLLKIADEFEKRKDDLVSAIKSEAGGSHGKAMFESGYIPKLFRSAASQNYQPIGEIMPSDYGKISMAIRKPIGVVTVISPWNFPVLLSARGLAFPLAMGNTVVLKPSEETPFTGGIIFAEIFEAAGVPDGVLNVITCSKNNVGKVGDILIEHPHIKGISFTGSTPVGRMIAAKAGAHLKKCCVELGGKDPLIICEDADIEKAALAANFGSFFHQGQVCMSVEKILVHEQVFEKFLDNFKRRASKLKLGSPNESEQNSIGPIINDNQLMKIKSQLDDAISKGAKIELGGKIEGRFIEPTILTNISSDMKIYDEETFGPIVIILPFRNDEEAINLANDSQYGLSSGVFTNNEERGFNIANSLETGMCHVNCSSINDEPHIPFGGSKSSGLGRHGGRWSTETFTETRWVTLDRGKRPFPPAF